jgi:hypothetical protein
MNSPQFFTELKRRNLRRLAAGYVTMGFVVIVVEAILLAFLEAVAGGVRILGRTLVNRQSPFTR